jgi:hypothetical protein
MDARPPLGFKTDNRFLMTRDERENKVALPLGGRAADRADFRRALRQTVNSIKSSGVHCPAL